MMYSGMLIFSLWHGDICVSFCQYHHQEIMLIKHTFKWLKKHIFPLLRCCLDGCRNDEHKMEFLTRNTE